jgi:beta-ureidopropionase / N-carbamoyl-L-amino-acid hydrolase
VTGPAIDAARVIADLRELQRRTGNEDGAQRLCWGEGWRTAREFLAELLGELGLAYEVDDAGNAWTMLDGTVEPPLAVGSHLDSVPDGGWLDGALGVVAGVGVLRAWASAGEPPARSLVLVDWADEEGARFGVSLFGSSAFAGTLSTSIRRRTDAEGNDITGVLRACDVDLGAALGASASRRELAAYLELHIEQGPVLEAEGLGAAAVAGCVGIERHRVSFTGQASHAGTTPMDRRRDAGLAAADTELRVEGIGRDAGGMATTGSLILRPGIPTAVAGEAELLVDLRHADADRLASMLDAAMGAAREAAAARGCAVSSERIWSIAPTAFDPGLVDAAAAAVKEATGSERRLTSGALHDAAEVARILPAAMMFVPSIAGISHAKEEDTSEADLVRGIEAFGALANRVLAD